VRGLLAAVAKNIGADNLRTIEYTGGGMVAAPGQAFDPIPVLIGVPEAWPRFVASNYTRTIDYTTMSSRETYTRKPPDRVVRFPDLEGPAQEHGNLSDPRLDKGGGGINNPAPIVIDLRNNKGVAWDVVNNKPVRQWQYLAGIDAGEYRQLEIILTPHGFLKAALAPGANPRILPPPAGRGGRGAAPAAPAPAAPGAPVRVELTNVLGKYTVIGTLEENYIRRVETTIPTPVVGDMRIDHEYTEWRDFGGVKMWTYDHSHFVEAYNADNRQLRITAARANVTPAADLFAVPADVAQVSRPEVRVQATQLAPTVWFLGGGSHNSVLVESADFVTVIEAPLNDERSNAVIAEVKRLVPNKPIRYVVNTHYHWDHSGGLRAYVGAGAQIVTHQRNVEYYQRVLARPRTLMPDNVTAMPQFVGINGNGVLGDAANPVMRFYDVGTGSPPYSNHNEFFLVAYLPNEGLLINADLYTPPAANGTLAPQALEGVTALGHIIKQFNLKVTRHVPLHGQPGPHDQFVKLLGDREVLDAHGPLVAPPRTAAPRTTGTGQ
jgi:hypothetical protein